ncbi:MAG: hypothetical protein WC468_01765 [Candidatus Paceibacterota bacterium]
MNKDLIKFEISDSCSGGLNCSLMSRGWQNQEFFNLPIKKGPVFLFLEKLIPDCVCLFHIGCSSDSRSPSFEHTIKYGDIRHRSMIFSYQRILYPGVFWDNDWFHDLKGNRNLEATAQALSNPKNYYELIKFSWDCTDDEIKELVLVVTLELSFRNNQLYSIRGFNDIQEKIFQEKINGFKGSLLDLNEGPLKSKRNIFLNDLNARDWIKIFNKNGIKVNDLIKEIYNLFQASAPQFGEQRKTREPLLIFAKE